MNQTANTWPDRPEGFYEDWSVFCSTVLTQRIRNPANSNQLAVALLAGGSLLGAGGFVALIKANQDILDAKAREWGVPNLSAMALSGGAILGAALGGLGGALLTRVLSRNAPQAQVDALHSRLAAARQEFETLRREKAEGLRDEMHYRLGIELLFNQLEKG